MSLTAFRSSLLVLFFCFSISSAWAGAAPANDQCTSPTLLTSSSAGVCSSPLDIQNATNGAPTGSLGGATSSNTYDVWFTYKAKSTPVSIKFNFTGTEFATLTPYIEVFSGTCGSFTLIASGPASSRLTVSGLTANSLYYIRMYVTSNPNANGSGSGNYGYTVC